MVTLIHGDNTTLSFNYLTDLKKNFNGEAITLVAKEQTSITLNENFASQSLFETEKLIIIENPGSTKKLFDDLEVPTSTNVVLYEPKKLTFAEVQSFQKKLPGLGVQEFKLDPVVFKFVESLAPGNQKVMLPLWNEYIKSEEPEIALSMLARQVRLLLGGDDFQNLAPWQKDRVINQAKKFTKEQLIVFHSKLLEADYNSKSGQSPVTLSDSLELLLITL